ncbi:restriction endonuclease FokI C-terminal domain-containing protein [Elizabethkingia anophelis]|uniref:restriction endonuclease FokI C-terminal domain-containing protein n=1 Tax=Elizabethkingia anophelis TaxID=1117645 RepID=UPI001EE6B9C1|nr:restriction endonuclease FokI C-terminal domain-containing protein [Elizabethkingia anophelis]UKY85838.1 restriction endonuclease [Elizabethkingia anophelis]UKY99950.1 restriction endonuclease [Elizabethkingia anophelis]
MIPTDKRQQIRNIWDQYIQSNQLVVDTKGKELVKIDDSRHAAIIELNKFIIDFQSDRINVYEFKTNIDSFNKRNNLWGFTATKGQMFFNQLVKVNESNILFLTNLLKSCIEHPKNLEDALAKISKLEKFCTEIYSKAKDKRKVPNPGSVSYFLSYFWQVQDADKWPILYTSLINAFIELDIWQENDTQAKAYEYFFNLNEEIKKILSGYTGTNKSNWEAEHAFWNFKGNPNKTILERPKKETKTAVIEIEEEKSITVTASFELSDYLIPKVSKLIELGAETEKPSSSKGSAYEKLVAEIFKQLDFEVEILGQGSGRNPDAILRHREENTSFLVDAKAYSNGYSLGIDDRAIKEYINHYCPKLQKEGYKKIGFIIVSNSFKSNFDSFINEITWNTDIKRFILLSSEALLYLLAYKTKDRIQPSTIIETLVSLGNPIEANNIIQEFDDV